MGNTRLHSQLDEGEAQIGRQPLSCCSTKQHSEVVLPDTSKQRRLHLHHMSQELQEPWNDGKPPSNQARKNFSHEMWRMWHRIRGLESSEQTHQSKKSLHKVALPLECSDHNLYCFHFCSWIFVYFLAQQINIVRPWLLTPNILASNFSSTLIAFVWFSLLYSIITIQEYF